MIYYRIKQLNIAVYLCFRFPKNLEKEERGARISVFRASSAAFDLSLHRDTDVGSFAKRKMRKEER